MSNESTFDPTVARLTNLISRQFGCTFDYQPADAMGNNGEFAELRQSLSSGAPVSAGDLVFLPIFSGDRLVGAGRISPRAKITQAELGYVHQMVRLILEGRLNSLDRLDWLERYEDYARKEINNSATPSNVVSFRSLQKNTFPLQAKGRLDLLNFPFIIESAVEAEAYKMALEIHAHSQRYAFLPIQDLSAQALLSTESIAALGAMTIYISDLSQLTYGQQAQIAAFYANTREADTPQFIACAQMPVADLKRLQKVTPQIVAALMVGYLTMTEPFAYYKRSNVMDFFYSGLGPTPANT